MAAQLSQPAALTIAGSDSSGGAGLQADLRTLAKLGVHGASVVTCVTAQNPGAVSAIHPTPAKVVAAQLDSVFGSLPIRAVKTGMLYSRAIIEVVAERLAKRNRLLLVIDPVMLSSSGTPLLKPSAAQALAKRLLPLAMLVTPNLDEAAALAKRRVGAGDPRAVRGRGAGEGRAHENHRGDRPVLRRPRGVFALCTAGQGGGAAGHRLHLFGCDHGVFGQG